MFSAKDVKDLREKTGAGMMDCKKALENSNGDMEKAIDWLRENGIAKAAKKESRIAAEGLTKIVTSGNTAVILEVNSETDFVAKNEAFVSFVDELANILLNNDVKDMDSALALEVNGESVATKVANITAKIGEKISFRRFEKITKNDDEVFGSYSHMGGKIGVLSVIKGANEEVAKDVCMHAAAMNPAYLNQASVPAQDLEHEISMIKEEIKNDPKNASKPADIIEKMSVGRVQKFYKENCLFDQPFIKDDKLSVSEFVKNNGGEIVNVVRYGVGEGIQKREENFAEEVMNQING